MKVTEPIARAIYTVVIEECGADPEFISDFSSVAQAGDWTEWRFCGGLGFGGKLRAPGSFGRNYPVVTCYPEDETPTRQQAIDLANARLRSLVDGLLEESERP